MSEKMERGRRRRLATAAVVVLLGGLSGPQALALKPGDLVKNVPLRDASDKPANIPDLGQKVVVLFYTDPDVKDMNETFREKLKAQKLDKSKMRPLGVANLKDTWKPNFIIRKVIRGKIEKFKSVILTDKEHMLKRFWNLGDCDDQDLVIVIGRDLKVKFLKKTALTEAEIKSTIQLVKDLMAK